MCTATYQTLIKKKYIYIYEICEVLLTIDYGYPRQMPSYIGIVAIGKPERHVRKASHSGSNQQ